jgi:hypothetical protein
MLIIDCHCHAGKGDGLTGPWDTDAPLGPYLEWADGAGIHKTVLFAAFHSDYAVANRQVARIVQRAPERFYGFAFVHALRDRGRVFQLVQTAVTAYGFCGIKLHRFDARISREVCDTARHFRLPVLYDVVGEISVVELLGSEYPDVNFIIPHLGSFSDDWRAQAGLIDHLVRYPNIYTDTSGVRRFDILKKAFQRAGAGKILFGSDGPWLHPGVELAKIHALHPSPSEAQRMLSGNLLGLIGRVRRQPATHPPAGITRSAETPLPAPWRDPWLER